MFELSSSSIGTEVGVTLSLSNTEPDWRIGVEVIRVAKRAEFLVEGTGISVREEGLTGEDFTL